jgi:dipeptidyl aminopeptidase/acylaminoacyl peptidase
MKRIALLLFVVACGGSKPQTAQEPHQPTPPPDNVVPDHPAPPQDPTPPVAKGKPKQDLIPRTVLFGNPDRTNVQLSPDGKHIAWLAAKDGVMNVFVAPIDHLDKAVAITSDKTRPVRMYFWTFDNKHLLYQQDTGGDENFHVFRIDVAGGEALDLTPQKGARSEVIAASEKHPNQVLVQENDRDPHAFDIYEIDLTSGKRTLVFENKDEYAGFVPDFDNHLALAIKSQDDGSSQMFVPDGKKGWTAWDSIPFEDSQSTQPFATSLDGKKVYMLDSRPSDTAAFVEVDLKTKKSKILASDAKADIGNIFWHPTKHIPLAYSVEYERQKWHALDKSIQPDLDALAKLAGDGEFGIASMSLDMKTWIVGIGSPQHPGNMYLWNHAKHSGTFLFSTRPELDKQPLVGMESVVIPSRDGMSLVSYLTKPAGATGPVPMVLFVHGGPWGRDSYGYGPFQQLLANRGYAVLQVNFRGSTGLGKKFVNAANLEWGKKMHEDLLDAVKWAIDNGVTTKDQVAIMGGSYGGYSTLVGVTMTPEVFACGVDIVGPSNLLTLISTIPPYWKPALAQFKKRIGDWDTTDGKKLLEEVSPLTHAAAIKKPLMIGQGANDPRVKQAESQQIVDAMKKHGLPVTYILFPDEGHGFARPENNIAFVGAAEAFLSAHLGGYYLPLSSDEVKASTMQVKDGKQGIPGMP